MSKGRPPWRIAPLGAAISLLLSACSGSQSALDPASPAAELIADLWWPTLAVAGVVTVMVVALLLAGVFRAFRHRPERSLSVRRSRALVVGGGVVLPLAVTIPFVLSSYSIGRAIDAPAPEGALTVEVVGKRWWWEVYYHDDASRRIATTANEIHIPAGQPVRLLLRSDNVIHSFWVPSLHGKVDLIPGRVNAISLVADQPGVYRGQCAEFCGAQHALMGLLVIAQPPEVFAGWLARQQRTAMEPKGPREAYGREVFLNSSCVDCHTIRGTAADGETGPDLTHIGSRRTLAAVTIPNRPGYLGGWITDPQHVKPGSRMPPTLLAPAELNALIRYLESLQ